MVEYGCGVVLLNYDCSRKSALQLLIKQGIEALPIKLHGICVAEHIRLFNYVDGWDFIKRLSLEDSCVGNDAFCVGRIIFFRR